MNFKGYISSRTLNDGSLIDQKIQNIIIRDSCKKRNINFLLSATEYGMKNCFLILNDLLKDLKNNKYDGIVFFSLDQLPANKIIRNKIYKLLIKKKYLFFSREDILLCNKKDIDALEELIKIKNLLKYSPTKV